MSRAGFGSVMLLVSLAIVAAVFGMSSKHAGPTAKTATQAETQAAAESNTVNFQQAATALQEYQATNGTFAGATLQPVFGVTLASTTATSYCLQAGSGAAVQHEVGPGGSPAPGPC